MVYKNTNICRICKKFGKIDNHGAYSLNKNDIPAYIFLIKLFLDILHRDFSISDQCQLGYDYIVIIRIIRFFNIAIDLVEYPTGAGTLSRYTQRRHIRETGLLQVVGKIVP